MLYRSYIDKFTDEEIIKFANESHFFSEFTKKLGYKGNHRLGKNSRDAIKRKLTSLGIKFSDIYSKEIKKETIINYSRGESGKNSIKNGMLGEQNFVIDCINNDIIVSKPLNPNSIYDFVIDINSKLYKVQVKTSTSIKNNTTYFRTRCGKNGDKINYDIKDVDYFYLYSILRKKGFLVKNEGNSQSGYKIRFEKAQNNMKENIRYEEDYIFSKVIEEIKNQK